MGSLSKHRMELAKERLRTKLSFEYVTKIPAYRNLTKEKYESLINSIEAISLLLLETYINRAKI